MKKSIYILMMTLLAVMPVGAVSTTDKLVLSDVTLNPGDGTAKYATLSVVGAVRKYAAFNVDIYLPEGVEPLLSSAGVPRVTKTGILPKDDFDEEYLHTLSATYSKEDNKINVICYASPTANFTSMQGVLCRVYLTASAYAQYFKDFKDIHHLDVTAGYEYSKMKYWGNSWYKNYYPATSDKAGQINHEEATPWAGQVILVSWYGRANYTLLDRYLFTFTGRYDGSSRFKHGKQWGFFPAAAVAWRIKDEAFLKDVDPISDLKLRLSWGKTGQQDTGKEYYTPTYKVSTTNDHLYPVGPDNPGYLYKPLVYNDDLTWETTTTWNAGIDFGMFNQRLTLTLDGYIRKTTDLLCTPTIPAGQNFDNAMLLNAGSLKNTGFEVAITGRPIQSNDWFVEISANAAYNKNKITELYGGRDMIEAGMQVGTNEAITYHKVGKPANSFWVYQQVYDENGRPVQGVYVDRNADGSIDANDRYFYKNIAAPWTGGFALKVGYKNWDLGTNFRVSLGNYVYNDIEQGKINTSVLYNASKNYYDNSTQKIVSLGWDSYNYSLSDYFVQNASFLKCDNITLGYNFANVWKSNTYGGLSGRIYASCSNVFTWTKYPGLDPEQPGGKETSVYPRSRTFLLGLNLNF